MSEVQKSVEFMSTKYDDLLEKFTTLQEDHKADRKQISLLEQKIENLERNYRSNTLEIKNIPTKKGESNTDLYRTVKKTADLLDVPLQEIDVKNIYRVNTSNPSNKPVIMELTTVFKKDEMLTAVKEFNKKHSDNKLNTGHLALEGPVTPIFVAECLTYKTRKLFAMARDFARKNDWKYCWTSRGSVFLRVKDGSERVRICEEKDLSHLLK